MRNAEFSLWPTRCPINGLGLLNGSPSWVLAFLLRVHKLSIPPVLRYISFSSSCLSYHFLQSLILEDETTGISQMNTVWGTKYYAWCTNSEAHGWWEVIYSWVAGLADRPITHRWEGGGAISCGLMSETRERSSPEAAFYVTSAASLQEPWGLSICFPSSSLLNFTFHGGWLGKGSLTTEPQLAPTSSFAPSHSYLLLLSFFFSFIFISWRLIIYNIVVVFAIHGHESAMDLHVFPIPIPPPASHPIPSHRVFPVHQPWALVSCIQPGLVVCFTLDSILVSILLSQGMGAGKGSRGVMIAGQPRSPKCSPWLLAVAEYTLRLSALRNNLQEPSPVPTALPPLLSVKAKTLKFQWLNLLVSCSLLVKQTNDWLVWNLKGRIICGLLNSLPIS